MRRKYISLETMQRIRWDLAVANRERKGTPRESTTYLTLDPHGCGCCFIDEVHRVSPPNPKPRPSTEMRVGPGGQLVLTAGSRL